MELKWSDSRVVLPKRDKDHDNVVSVDVLVIYEGVVYTGFVSYETRKWYFYTLDMNTQLVLPTSYLYWAYFDLGVFGNNEDPVIDGD